MPGFGVGPEEFQDKFGFVSAVQCGDGADKFAAQVQVGFVVENVGGKEQSAGCVVGVSQSRRLKVLWGYKSSRVRRVVKEATVEFGDGA